MLLNIKLLGTLNQTSAFIEIPRLQLIFKPDGTRGMWSGILCRGPNILIILE